MRLTVLSLTLLAAGCYDMEASDFSSGSVEGSLRPFFADPFVCSCNLELSASARRVQYVCDSDDAPDYSLTFYTLLPPSANLRGVGSTQVQADASSWPSSGFGGGAAMLEYGSEDFGHPGLSEDEQVLSYRELVIWELDVPAQRICSELDPDSCLDLPAGHATDLRFTCLLGSR